MNQARKCAGYNPADDLVEVTYDGQNEKELFLKVQNRMLWFHQYLTEQRAFGTIDDSDVIYLPNAQLLLVKAVVTINGRIVGKACAGEFYNAAIGAQDPTICQTVATQAKGRALANAGFGTVDCIDHTTNGEPPYLCKASGVRKCGYDPRYDMMMLPEANGVQMPYLGVKYRVHWFNQYVAETERSTHQGDSYIDDSEVWYNEEAKLLTARARVILDGVLVGSSCASVPYDPTTPGSNGAVMRVCTQAKGRALANAGFGVAVSALEDGQSTQLCDSGVRITVSVKGTAEVKPLYQSAPEAAGTNPAPAAKRGKGRKKSAEANGAQGTQAPAQTAPDNAPGPEAAAQPEPEKQMQPESADDVKPKPDAATEASSTTAADAPAPAAAPVAAIAPAADPAAANLPPMSIDDALKYVMPLGAYKGMTMGEVWGKEQKIIRFYASPKFTNSRLVDIKRAAIAILTNVA